MSLSIDFFFNYDATIHDLAWDLYTALGIASTLDPVSKNLKQEKYTGLLLGMSVSLFEHNLINSGTLDFENYDYCLRLTTSNTDAEFRPYQVSTMAFLGLVLYKKLGITGILVYNTEKILSTYREKFNTLTGTRHLFDHVSQHQVCSPEHIAFLVSKIS